MRILSLLYVYFLVLDSQGIALVPAPENPKVLSNNFVHILQWNPGKGTKPGTVYNVNIGNKEERSISGTSIDVSQYMKMKYQDYTIKLWASYGNSSSTKVSFRFLPYTSTIIGPPMLSLSGCGDCLNVSIDLPNRQDDTFYNAISFEMYWRKAREDEDDCHSLLTKYQDKLSVSYSYVLKYLEPGQRYCVQAKPMVTSIPEESLLSSCACEFTSRIEPRGVAFLAAWVVGSLLVGSCFLTLIFSLIYTGYLCKPNARLPKALIVLVPGYFLSPEQTCISLAEVEYGIQIHQLHCRKKQKGSALCENRENVDKDDEDDDEEDEDEESHGGYMDRAVQRESESSGNNRSASVCDVAETPEGCSLECTPSDAKETLALSRLRATVSGFKGYDQAALFDPVTDNLTPPNTQEGKKIGGEMQGEDEKDEEEDSGNVNLWSVVFHGKPMQPKEEEANEPSEVKEPLLPLLLKDLQEPSLTAAKPQTGSSSELHTALLFQLQTSREDENDVSDTNMCDRMGTGYMASHTGTIDTGNYLSEDEEEDYTSGYMTR